MTNRQATSSDRAARRRTIVAATIGNTLEWYDFIVYGLWSTTLAKLFFPSDSEVGSVLLAVATFGVGFVMRPVGAIVLGLYADRVGRRAALSLTILIMSVGTGIIAVAPTHASIGVWAPALIVVARLLQGFSCGGELGGATAILVENAPAEHRGLYASWQVFSQGAGFVLGALVTMLVSLVLTPTQLEGWGWRLPFLFGLTIAPVGLYVRSRLPEPQLFLQSCSELRGASSTALRSEARQLLAGLGVSSLYVVSAYVLFVNMPVYAVRQLGIPFPQTLVASVVAGSLVLVCAPLMAKLSDCIGRRPVLLAAALAYCVLTYPAFVLVTNRPDFAVLTVVQAGFALMMSVYAGPVVSQLAELFPTRLRSTAVSLVYNVAAAVLGGFAPLVVTWLIAATGNPLAPAFYVIAAALISLVAAFAVRDGYRQSLR